MISSRATFSSGAKEVLADKDLALDDSVEAAVVEAAVQEDSRAIREVLEKGTLIGVNCHRIDFVLHIFYLFHIFQLLLLEVMNICIQKKLCIKIYLSYYSKGL